MSRAAAQRAPTAARTESELDHAVRELTTLGASLARSYHSLEERAQRVESELAAANRELGRKVEQLDAVTAELEAVLDALPTGVVVRDARGRIVRVNDAALGVLGAQREQLLGSAEPLLGAAPAADGWRQHEWLREGGVRSIVARRCSSIRGGSRAAGRAQSVEILDDRTQLVELSERMHALDKLAALGDMAGGIAHELRNPMSAAKGFADLLVNKLAHDDAARLWAELIVQGVDEANAILTSMMSLASPEKLVLETIEPAELVHDAVAMARRDAHIAAEDQRWTISSSVAAPAFGGDRIKLRQALRNLVANALQAQPHGGAVRIEALQVEGALEIRVHDAGPGIPRALSQRVLEPFFTTRAEGTGLGLALVDRIAALHGGRVRIEPDQGPLGGASIALVIPTRPNLS